jgi:hypothetical protein
LGSDSKGGDKGEVKQEVHKFAAVATARIRTGMEIFTEWFWIPHRLSDMGAGKEAEG